MYTYLLFAALALAPTGSSAKDCGSISKVRPCEKGDGCVWSRKAGATRKTCNVDDTIVVGCETFDKKSLCETEDSNCEWRRANKGSQRKTCNDPATAAPTSAPTGPPTAAPTPTGFEDTLSDFVWQYGTTDATADGIFIQGQQGCCRGANPAKKTAGGGDESNLQAVTTTMSPVSNFLDSDGFSLEVSDPIGHGEWCFETCAEYSRQHQLADYPSSVKNADDDDFVPTKYCTGFQVSKVKANKKKGRAAQWKCEIYDENVGPELNVTSKASKEEFLAVVGEEISFVTRANKSCKKESTMCFPVSFANLKFDVDDDDIVDDDDDFDLEEFLETFTESVFNGTYNTAKGCCDGKPLVISGTPEITSGATADEARDECQGLCSMRLKNDRQQPCYAYELRTKKKGKFVCELHGAMARLGPLDVPMPSILGPNFVSELLAGDLNVTQAETVAFLQGTGDPATRKSSKKCREKTTCSYKQYVDIQAFNFDVVLDLEFANSAPTAAPTN